MGTYYMQYVGIAHELMVSRYVAESTTTDAGRFSRVGLCQLRTKLCTKPFATLCTQLTKPHAVESSRISFH